MEVGERKKRREISSGGGERCRKMEPAAAASFFATFFAYRARGLSRTKKRGNKFREKGEERGSGPKKFFLHLYEGR